MKYQIINARDDKKRKVRMRKELNEFSARLNSLVSQSHNLLIGLKGVAIKKPV